ncbi:MULTISPECIES: TetR/AcrR family transcriptional regulator [Curtobacterium]|uniref:TetR/AcrR family transcriptional regulator n=1 Tax=Curtobacterium flaccumfaciens TaxID=2035 RepID=UPI00310859D9
MTEPISRKDRRAATAARILEAAQGEFADRGPAATVRSIAARAGVDPSLVLQHYGSKDRLFALAVHPVDTLGGDEVDDHLRAVLDARLGDLPPATMALIRSMSSSAEAAGIMRAYLQERVDALAAASAAEDAELRATVVVASILGLTIARHVVGLRGLGGDDDAADAPTREQVAELVEPWLAALLA